MSFASLEHSNIVNSFRDDNSSVSSRVSIEKNGKKAVDSCPGEP